MMRPQRHSPRQRLFDHYRAHRDSDSLNCFYERLRFESTLHTAEALRRFNAIINDSERQQTLEASERELIRHQLLAPHSRSAQDGQGVRIFLALAVQCLNVKSGHRFPDIQRDEISQIMRENRLLPATATVEHLGQPLTTNQLIDRGWYNGQSTLYDHILNRGFVRQTGVWLDPNPIGTLVVVPIVLTVKNPEALYCDDGFLDSRPDAIAETPHQKAARRITMTLIRQELRSAFINGFFPFDTAVFLGAAGMNRKRLNLLARGLTANSDTPVTVELIRTAANRPQVEFFVDGKRRFLAPLEPMGFSPEVDWQAAKALLLDMRQRKTFLLA